MVVRGVIVTHETGFGQWCVKSDPSTRPTCAAANPYPATSGTSTRCS